MGAADIIGVRVGGCEDAARSVLLNLRWEAEGGNEDAGAAGKIYIRGGSCEDLLRRVLVDLRRGAVGCVREVGTVDVVL